MRNYTVVEAIDGRRVSTPFDTYEDANKICRKIIKCGGTAVVNAVKIPTTKTAPDMVDVGSGLSSQSSGERYYNKRGRLREGSLHGRH